MSGHYVYIFQRKMSLLILPCGRFIAQIANSSPAQQLFLFSVCVCVCVCVCYSLSCVQLFATPSTAAHQIPLSLEFSRQEHWNGLLFPSPGFLPDLGTKPGSSALQAHSLSSEPPGKPFLCFYIFTFPYH